MPIDPTFEKLRRGVPGPQPGQAIDERFQEPEKIKAAPELQMSDDNKEGKIFLGLIGANVTIDPKQEYLPDGRKNRHAIGGQRIGIGDDRHIVTVAGSRAGKGRAVLVPNLITYPGSVLVIDPKGDLAKLTADRRRQLGQTVYVLDPFGTAGNTGDDDHYPGRFNPLAMLAKSKQLLADAALIADALVMPLPGNKDPHWDDSARNFIEGLILHVATSAGIVDGGRNLVTLYQLLADVLRPAAASTPERPVYLVQVAMQKSELPAVKYAATEFYDRSPRERDSVLSTVRRHLHFLGFPEMQKTLAGKSIDLLELKQKPTTIFLTLPAMRMGSCSRWLRLFVNMALASFEMDSMSGGARPERPPLPVLMVLDEFAVLGTMQMLVDAAGQIAGLGCRLWVVLQDLGQLRALYSDRWETFMGNAGVLQFFGNSELSTLDWIAKRLGMTMIRTESQSGSGSGERAAVASFSDSTTELMSGPELARFFGRDDTQLRQLIIRPTVPPIILQRAFYDKYPFFRGKYTIQPAGS